MQFKKDIELIKNFRMANSESQMRILRLTKSCASPTLSTPTWRELIVTSIFIWLAL